MYKDFEFMFDVFHVIFIVMFCIVGIIIFVIIKGLTERNNNNKNSNSPVFTVNATVVAKRIDAPASTTGYSMHSTSAWYYATFQKDSGERIEFLIPDQKFGMLVEGDIGNLTFQGKMYKSFVRESILQEVENLKDDYTF